MTSFPEAMSERCQVPERNVEEWIDPSKWPQYLLGVLRNVSEEIANLKKSIFSIKEKFSSEHEDLDERIRNIVRDEMKNHEEHHRMNEPLWGIDPWRWAKRWWWGIAIIIAICLVLLGHYMGAPYREILAELKRLKDAGLLK